MLKVLKNQLIELFGLVVKKQEMSLFDTKTVQANVGSYAKCFSQRRL